MNIHTIYQCCLLLHITGFIFFIGTTVTDFVALKKFWQCREYDQPGANAIWHAVSKFPVLMGVGMMLIIITAVGMMAITHGAYGEQTWMRIKFPLVVIAIINGLLIRRRQGSKLSKLFDDTAINQTASFKHIRNNLNAFHYVQFILFSGILLLSVFKFN
jgi:uncharacterized membrane protein SirB2